MHMDLYFHVKSEHNLLQKQPMPKMLIHWVRTVCDAESLDKEINHLRKTFKQNGHSSCSVKHTLATKQKPQIQIEKLTSVSLI